MKPAQMITVVDLKKLGACFSALKCFREFFGQAAKLTHRNYVLATEYLGLDLDEVMNKLADQNCILPEQIQYWDSLIFPFDVTSEEASVWLAYVSEGLARLRKNQKAW